VVQRFSFLPSFLPKTRVDRGLIFQCLFSSFDRKNSSFLPLCNQGLFRLYLIIKKVYPVEINSYNDFSIFGFVKNISFEPKTFNRKLVCFDVHPSWEK
jgi:hypothetical protein